MNWMELLKVNKKCTHDKLPIEDDIGYCPDCGELVENHWYLTRCVCCGVKLRTTIRNGEVVPEENFCHNCGCREYIVEKLEKIDCININYAMVLREVVKNEVSEYTQSWQEVIQTSGYIPKLPQ